MQTIVRTGISLQRSLFDQAEELARSMNVSRSRLFALALEDYLERQRNRELFAQLNEAYADGLDEDERTRLRLASHAHRRVVEGEW